MNKTTYTEKRKVVTKIILITIYSAFIGYLLGSLQSIADWNYTIHEMMFIPFFIAYYVFPFELCIWLYYAVKSTRETKENMIKPKMKLYFSNSLLLMSLIIIISYFYIQSMNVSTGGLFEVENKIEERNNYYIQMNHKKIKCNKNVYNLIEEDKVYLVDFTWNKKWPQKGKLEYIEATDVIFD